MRGGVGIGVRGEGKKDTLAIEMIACGNYHSGRFVKSMFVQVNL